ncbi:MAG TPA: putative toxin-antitoxin system toxin component, PIN family [Rhodanobacteraceae bacterium]|nr:putative toxin-antitoxin system toxin component, PIN family [Rhodanobacteraceae bacterium]
MNRVARVVFDTSTLVGAMLQVGSVPHRALELALASTQLCASPATLRELERVITRRKFDRYQAPDIRRGFLAVMRANSRLFDVSASDESMVEPPCRDPQDNKFLALVRGCHADVLVSSDADLLAMHPWQGVRILTAAAFLELLGA